MQVIRETDTVEKIVFTSVLETMEGGAVLNVAELPTTIEDLLEGTPLAIVSLIAHVVKTAVVNAASTSTSLKVDKNHMFIVGDFINNGAVSTAIVSIDTTTSAVFDTMVLTAAMTVAEDDVLNAGTSETTNDTVVSTAVVEDVASDTLTTTFPIGTNGKSVTISQNSSDALAVTIVQGNIAIALADTTPANNTAATIQAAIRAHGVTDGYDFTLITCAAGANWDTAATGGTLTVPTDDSAGGTVFNPLGIPPLYTAEGLLFGSVTAKDAVTNSNNVLVALLTRGTVNEVALPYSLTSEIKTALTDRVNFA